MADNRMNDSVGKKIVEALKMQTHEDEHDSSFAVESSYGSEIDSFDSYSRDDEFGTFNQGYENPEVSSDIQSKIQQQLREPSSSVQFGASSYSSSVDTAFQQSIARNLGTDTYAQIPDEFDYPANVAVLRQLIAKLPSGVSKQTGATIIRQTMEALGISMPSVIQEAKQVQETLVSNSKECQANIVEYRKQIGILEAKSQQYQRQSAVMNDIINLFIKS